MIAPQSRAAVAAVYDRRLGRAVSPMTAAPSFLCAFAPLREIPSVLVPLCLGGEKTVCPSLPKIKPIKPKSNRFLKNHPNSTLDLGCLESSSSSSSLMEVQKSPTSVQPGPSLSNLIQPF
jgi:hypothetical protein